MKVTTGSIWSLSWVRVGSVCNLHKLVWLVMHTNYYYVHSLFQPALMMISELTMKWWRSVSMASGDTSVTLPGAQTMHKWLADSWVSQV